MRVSLSLKEAELWRAFQAYLNLNQKQTFTVDDLRAYFSEERLREVFPDPVHDIGLWCLKLMKSGEIRKVGTTYGRYNRVIKLYSAIL